VAKRQNVRTVAADEAGSGLWHQPALMHLLADVLIVFAVAGLAWAMLNALQRLPLFPLRELVLQQAPRQVSIAQLEHTARHAVQGNFFTVDLEATRQAFEKLPWVRHVALRRLWPDGMYLAVEEHEAIARWQRLDGEPGLVNRQGEVFDAELPDEAPRLPQLQGPDGTAAELLRRHAEFSQLLAATGQHIANLSLSPRLAWQLHLDDGLTIKLGRDLEQASLQQRLARFAQHYEKIKPQGGSLRIADMRYPNGFALVGTAAALRNVKEPAERKS
jgi:cell division protein FtsQ